MNDILEDRGNAVKINDTIIPAVNIQVEGVPGFIGCECPHDCIERIWYGVYFEIMFEDGSLWEINCHEKEDSNDDVVVIIYENWHKTDAFDDILHFPGWQSFVAYYKLQKK